MSRRCAAAPPASDSRVTEACSFHRAAAGTVTDMARPATPDYGERVLRLDPPMTGRDVWELQIKLLAWGSGSDPDGIGSPNMPVRVTGKFDRATRDAVKRLQNALTLPVTGV